MLKKQFNLFRFALMYYSRIPSGYLEYDEESLRESLRYFPLVGLIVAAIGGGVWSVCFSLLHLGTSVATALSLVTMVMLTGGIHEDGLSDFCDGFGGGYTRERVLAIMKDSSTGVYGILALILDFGLKFALITTMIPERVPLVLLVAHASSRTLPMLLYYTSQYVRTENIKSEHLVKRMSTWSLVISLIIGLAPLVTLSVWDMVGIVVGYAVLFVTFRGIVLRRIGGYTGDVLGALQQLAEILFLLIIVIVQNNVAR